MGPDVIMDLFRQALVIIIMMVSVIVVPSLIAGLVVSVFQAATQINEQSLSFIPRLLIIFVTLIVTMPWLSGYIHDFTINIFEVIPTVLN